MAGCVGAELVIHGGDLRHCSSVALGHDDVLSETPHDRGMVPSGSDETPLA
jgi:hypothetical protein